MVKIMQNKEKVFVLCIRNVLILSKTKNRTPKKVNSDPHNCFIKISINEEKKMFFKWLSVIKGFKWNQVQKTTCFGCICCMLYENTITLSVDMYRTSDTTT